MVITWSNISASLRYLFAGIIATLNGTTLFTPHDIKVWSFCLAIAIIILKSIDALKSDQTT